MRKSYKRHNEEFKLSVLRDYYASGMSKRSCARKYELSDVAVLYKWLEKYSNHPDLLPLMPKQETMESKEELGKESETARLRKRIADLEKALAFSKLETKSRDMLIDKAEEYFGIPIRKKSGAK